MCVSTSRKRRSSDREEENVETGPDESVAHTFDGWDFPQVSHKKMGGRGWLLDLQPCSCHKLIIGL